MPPHTRQGRQEPRCRACRGAAGLGDRGGRDLTKTSGRLPGKSCGRWRCQHRPRGCGGQSLRPGHPGRAWHPQGLINRQRRSVAGSNAARGFPSLCQSTWYGAAPDASDAGPQRPLPSKPTPLWLRPLLLPEVLPLRPQGPPVPRLSALLRTTAPAHAPHLECCYPQLRDSTSPQLSCHLRLLFSLCSSPSSSARPLMVFPGLPRLQASSLLPHPLPDQGHLHRLSTASPSQLTTPSQASPHLLGLESTRAEYTGLLFTQMLRPHTSAQSSTPFPTPFILLQMRSNPGLSKKRHMKKSEEKHAEKRKANEREGKAQ